MFLKQISVKENKIVIDQPTKAKIVQTLQQRNFHPTAINNLETWMAQSRFDNVLFSSEPLFFTSKKIASKNDLLASITSLNQFFLQDQKNNFNNTSYQKTPSNYVNSHDSIDDYLLNSKSLFQDRICYKPNDLPNFLIPIKLWESFTGKVMRIFHKCLGLKTKIKTVVVDLDFVFNQISSQKSFNDLDIVNKIWQTAFADFIDQETQLVKLEEKTIINLQCIVNHLSTDINKINYVFSINEFINDFFKDVTFFPIVFLNFGTTEDYAKNFQWDAYVNYVKSPTKVQYPYHLEFDFFSGFHYFAKIKQRLHDNFCKINRLEIFSQLSDQEILQSFNKTNRLSSNTLACFFFETTPRIYFQKENTIIDYKCNTIISQAVLEYSKKDCVKKSFTMSLCQERLKDYSKNTDIPFGILRSVLKPLHFNDTYQFLKEFSDVYHLGFDDRLINEIVFTCKKEDERSEQSFNAGSANTNALIYLGLPFNETPKNNYDLVKISQDLDLSHIGLNKVKQKILRFLTNKKNIPDYNKVMCLVGAPGIGKTSLLNTLSSSIKIPFKKVGINTLDHSSTTFYGSDNVYVGSSPGLIISSIHALKTTNIMIVLDEIDKINHPAIANELINLLDNSNKKTFLDKYLTLPYDISNILFIATANYLENIPAPLYDRLDIIDIDNYSESEKVIIAHKIIADTATALKIPNQININETTIKTIITKLTLEAGVRNLEKILKDGILDKINELQKNNQPLTNIEINYDFFKKSSGLNEIQDEILYSEVGRVNVLSVLGGLVGNLSQIETVVMIGNKKQTILTGNLSEMIKESCNIAINYLKTNWNQGLNLSKYYKKINKKSKTVQFENFEFYLNFPTASKKDGNSAGSAITTAFLSSLFNVPIPTNIAMTGEITLHGKVKAVGGLKEKMLNAYNKGIRKFYISNENQNEVIEKVFSVNPAIEKCTIFIDNYEMIFQDLFMKGKLL